MPAILCCSSSPVIITTPATAKRRLNNCNLLWRSAKKKKPIVARKKICKLLSKVECQDQRHKYFHAKKLNQTLKKRQKKYQTTKLFDFWEKFAFSISLSHKK